MALPFKFEKGQTVRDRITGVQGVITSRTDHITGCNRYVIQPKAKQDGKYIDGVYCDENSLEAVKGKAILDLSPKKTGVAMAG